MVYKNGLGRLKLLSERRFEIAIFIVIILTEVLIFGVSRLKPQSQLYETHQPAFKKGFSHQPTYKKALSHQPAYEAFTLEDLGDSQYTERIQFDPNEDEIFIILHIQKTGGTNFESRLVKTLNVTTPCVCQPEEKRCTCLNKHGHIWVVSGQFSVKWPCRLHADWTELNECIDKYFDKIEGLHRNRSYLYVTLVREPIQRYISEWRAIQRGAKWNRKYQRCGVLMSNLPNCSKILKRNVELDDFMNCPHNLAINRQTRMLANLSLVDCYNRSTMPDAEREKIMLESAKTNLRNMAYFGLTEYQGLNQLLFEYTFGINFTQEFTQIENTFADEAKGAISSSQLEKIKELNKLDTELYMYAKELYFKRIEAIKSYITSLKNSERYNKNKVNQWLNPVKKNHHIPS